MPEGEFRRRTAERQFARTERGVLVMERLPEGTVLRFAGLTAARVGDTLEMRLVW